MTGHPLLALLVLASAGGQDPVPAARPEASYRAAVSVDEPARTLRGTLQIRLPRSAGDSLPFVTLDPGTARLGAVRLNGAPTTPQPAGSTLVQIAVPPAPPTGDTLLIELDFVSPAGGADAAGPSPGERHLEFRGWVPRLLAPGGWPHVAPGTFLVTLDLAADQVVGATGMPLCGDPGWAGARRPPGRPVTLRGNAYPVPRDAAARSLGAEACAAPDSGRKRVVFYAEDVRDFVLTMDPAFRYEEGDIFLRPIRVLYLPADARTWGAGVAVRRTETALAWLKELFGERALDEYPWPQATAVHASHGEGTAEAMFVATASPDQETVVRELGRLYLADAVAVAPADADWLDQGLAWLLSDLYLETQGWRSTYRRLERAQLDAELDGRARPVLASMPPGAPDSAAAQRARFLLHRLRAALGDAATDSVLHAYWVRARLRSADESLFVAVLDSAAPGHPGRRLAAALRDATPVDYAVGMVRRERLPSGRWRATAEVRRLGGGTFPFEVRVIAEHDTVTARADGAVQRETLTVETATPPVRVVLDPIGTSHDWNVLNNQRSFGFRLLPDRRASDFLDPYFARPSRRDRLVHAWAPLAWYDDAGGWTLGVRRRDDYLGRFDLDELWLTKATLARASGTEADLDGRLVLRNPTWLRSPGLGERLEVARSEGRVVAALGVDQDVGRTHAGVSLSWVGALTTAYLDTARYQRAGTLELEASGGADWSGDAGRARVGVALAGGWASWRADSSASGTGDAYARFTATAAVDRALGYLHLRARGWVGAVLADGRPLRQRRIFLAGPDPYAQLSNPFLRSRGALLTRGGVYYQDPGGAGLRGFSPQLSARQAYGLSLELERDLWKRSGSLAQRGAVAAFGDAALADGDLDPTGRLTGAADAGLGLRLDHRIGATSFQTRFDFPVWVSRPKLAQDTHPGARQLGFRWTFSFAPSF